MESDAEKLLLHLLVLLVINSAVSSSKCPSMPIDNLICYNDFNRSIACEWNSTEWMSDRRYSPDAPCTIYAEYARRFYYNGSCNLEPVDPDNPARRKCSMILKSNTQSDYFQYFHKVSISVTCQPVKEILNRIKYYTPACHVKLNPPGKPTINVTTVSWLAFTTKDGVIPDYESELQWKQWDQSWSECHVVKKGETCTEELELDSLIQGEMYEARARVLPGGRYKGAWSDWGPTASWSSPVGKTKPPSDVVVGVVHIVVAFVAVFALLMGVFVLKNHKTTWVYMIKRIRGPPVPNPAESFLQDSWLSPHFTSDSFHSFMKPVDILSVEVTSKVDVVIPYKREEKSLKKLATYDSTNSSFSNPSYSELCSPPPVISLTPGNLEPCAADSPYGPVGSQSEEGNAEQDDNKMRGRDMEIFKLLSKSSSSSSELLQVDSDYKKTEQIQAERLRLQSLDSGMCSCEEVSQESMEVDSINVSDSHDEELEEEEEEEEEVQKEGVDVQKVAIERLFGIKGGVFGKESITICSGYEKVQNLQADSLELASLDSGVSIVSGEQASQEETPEGVDNPTESTRFLFPPPPSIALPCSLLPMPQPPSSLSSALRPPLSHVLERIARMSSADLVEPSGDGYLPVTQKQC